MGPSWATCRTCAFHFDCNVLTVEGVEACDVAPEMKASQGRVEIGNADLGDSRSIVYAGTNAMPTPAPTSARAPRPAG
jgi:hypothetical protein